MKLKKKLSNRRWTALAGLCLAAPLVQAQTPTLADRLPRNVETGDALQFRVGAGIERDSNVLRTPNKVSDEVGILSAGARFDKQYSLQRITLDVEAATYRHRDLDSLDYTTLNYLGAWNFAFTPRLQGVLSAERRQYRDITNTSAGFGDVNLRTERNEAAEATWAVTGGWRAQGALTHSSSKSDDPRALESSPDINSVRVGAGYEYPSGTTIIGQVRRGDGEYDRAGIDFKETEPGIVVRWPITAKTRLNTKLGRLKREHDNAPERDFSGTVGTFDVVWEYSPKTRVTVGYARDLGSYEFTGGGHISGKRYYIAPVWRPTAKTAVILRYQRETRDWEGVVAGAPDAGRSDRTTYTGATFEWEPRRNLVLSTGLRGEKRDSNLPNNDFSATILALGAKFTF